MYGTFIRMKARPGNRQKVVEHFNKWHEERQPMVRGAKGGVMLAPDASSDRLVGVAVFEDEATYRANADDPAQHEWYTGLREMLEEDPEWDDGEISWAEIT